MHVLDNTSASLVPLALGAAVFFWKAHRWRHPARTYWSACLILLAVVTFVTLLADGLFRLVTIYGRAPGEFAGGAFLLTVGAWIAGRLILRAEPKPFRRSGPDAVDDSTRAPNVTRFETHS